MLWLCWAHGSVEQNVAGEGLDGALPAMPAVKAHFRALPYHEVAAALETVDGSKASKAAKLCLRFLILTAARSGEAREWRIPGERMKGGAGHRVPLSDAALVVLERARALDDGSGLIFPSPLRPGRPLSPMTLTKILRDRGLAEWATVHGFRSTFRDWCAETGKPREIAEAALAHTVGGVEGGPISALTCTRVGGSSWTSGRRSWPGTRPRWCSFMDEQRDARGSARALLQNTEFLRALILENAVGVPEAADFLYQWDQIPPEAMDPRFTGVRARDVLVMQYVNWSHTKPWAWEGRGAGFLGDYIQS